MLTPEEIKKICTEYVDELFAYDDMSEQENIEAKNDAFVMCMAFAGHILEKHCIVPKSKVRDYYNNQQRQLNAPCSDPRDAYEQKDARSQILAITNLFGKSLFEEEK